MQAKATRKVRVTNTLSRDFEIANGVRQGSIIGLFLVNLAIDWIMQNALCHGIHGISLDDTYVPYLDFADDICLLDDNAEDVQPLLVSVFHQPKNFGLKINASKTKFCSIDPNINITCSGEQLERVETFTYLGSSIQPDSDIAGEIKLRYAKSLGSIKKLIKFWRSRNISTTIKSKVHHACIRSSQLYCCETWPLITSVIKKLAALRSDAPDPFSTLVAPSRLLTSVEIFNSIAASPGPSRRTD